MKKPATTPISPQDQKPALETLLMLAQKHGASKADAIATNGRSLSIGVRAGKLEDIDNSEGEDIGLRVFVGGRQACVSSSDLSQGSLEKLAERAVAMAKLAPEDPWAALADADKLATTEPDLDIFDPVDVNADNLFARAAEVEAAALNVKGVKQAEGANAHCVSAASFFMTSDGFAKGWRSSRHGLSVAAFAGDGANMERDYDYAGTRWLSDLPAPGAIGAKAAARVLARLGATQMSSGAMPVMFDRRVASSLLSSFIGAISGPAIARGVSYLKDAMDTQVFGSGVNITDDPLRMRGTGSRPWDGEGVMSKPLGLIEDGMLRSWMLNTATAAQLGLTTTGHASRDISTPPGVSSSNTHIHAGAQSPESMMKDIGEGLLITEMFGPSINPNTGDYSVGIAGFAIKNGTRSNPVNEVTVAGNLLDMFKNLTPANDLKFDDPIAAPSLLVGDMVIAGE